MKLLEVGTQLDGFTIEECIHSGGMAHIYRVRYTEGARDPGFPLAMKIPRMTAGLGAAVALAVHSLHQHNTVHLDLKPANVLIRPDGSAVLLDFGLSCNALYPDLLAEQLRKAVGSPACASGRSPWTCRATKPPTMCWRRVMWRRRW